MGRVNIIILGIVELRQQCMLLNIKSYRDMQLKHTFRGSVYPVFGNLAAYRIATIRYKANVLVFMKIHQQIFGVHRRLDEKYLEKDQTILS